MIDLLQLFESAGIDVWLDSGWAVDAFLVRRQPLLRLGVFIGVDGVTLSADGKKLAPYKAMRIENRFVPMSPAELTDVAEQLRSAGLFEEALVHTAGRHFVRTCALAVSPANGG